ncbi:hypothetical protein [Hyphococcus lacteus]|uniref:HEAT repeat domain-containing protein n=1 Tax=Hyphococcus lacteus TaxID=3143536 RepID=A0ABV3Z4I7_9PROT
MDRLRTLGALVGGSLIISIIYGVTVGNNEPPIDFDIDDSEGVHLVVTGDKGTFSLRRDELRMEAQWRGEYVLNDTADDIKSLDHKLAITREKNGVTEKAIYERNGDDVERRYFIDEEEQEKDVETDSAMRQLLTGFLGASGVRAEERVAALLQEGGVSAVLDKYDALYGDHARERYSAELIKQADLTPAELRSLLEALSVIESDTTLRTILGDILSKETVRTEDIPYFLKAASNIDSDYDMRRLIETVSEHPMNGDAIALSLGLFETIDSEHDLRLAGEALLKQPDLDADNITKLLLIIRDQMDSAHDMRLLLVEAAPFMARDNEVAKAWFSAFAEIDSDHDKRLALSDASEINDLPPNLVRTLIDSTNEIDSDHDRRLALENFAGQARSTPILLEAYKAAAEGIDSDYDRQRALESVGIEAEDTD